MFLNQFDTDKQFTKEQARNWIEEATNVDYQPREDPIDVIEESSESSQNKAIRKTDPIIDSTPIHTADPDDLDELIRLVKEMEETNLIGFIDSQPEKDTFFDELLSVDPKRLRIDARRSFHARISQRLREKGLSASTSHCH